MHGDRAPDRSGVRQNKRRDDATDADPAARVGKRSTQPQLDVKPSERVLEITDRALHLDDQHDAGAGLERQQIHAAAVSVVIETDLGSHAPTRRGEERSRLLFDRGMRRVKQPIELLALPPKRDVHRRSQGLCDALDRPDRHASNEAALNPRNGRSGHGGLRSEVRLTPTMAAAEMADGTRQVRANHRRMMSLAAYQPVTLWPVPDMTYEELLALARRLEGERLKTVTGKGFTVGVSSAENCPFFTPESSGYGQSDGRKAAERFLRRYNEIGSLRPGAYADVTRNASYYVSLVARA